MRFTSVQNLGDTITTLREDADKAGCATLDLLEQSQVILEGFVLAAKRLGLSDVYGIMRGNIADDKGADAQKIEAALDMLQNSGVPTEEADLTALLKANTG
jgi:hypothetical protein